MKRFFVILTTLTMMISTLSADFFRLDAGAGAWMQTPMDNTSPSNLSDETTTTEPYIWAYLKHPVPIIPNLRAEYVGVETKNVASTSNIIFKQLDVIPYYNILDNLFWITLDLGLDFKVIDGSNDKGSRGTIASTELFPLGYVRARVEIPATDIGFEADVKYIEYSQTVIQDVRVKIDYTFSGYVVSPAIELGYRIQKIQTDEFFNSEIDLEFSGVYLGLMLIY